MNALTRLERLDDLFPEMFRRWAMPMRVSEDLPAEIRLDLVENDKNYEVRAEIPGAKKEDIKVSVDNNYVSIEANVRRESETKGAGRTLLKETYCGSVSRGFTLSHEVDAKGVLAKLEDGVLKLTLPKLEGGGMRAITIQ